MDIITYCFKYVDFKIMNMEAMELISETLKDLLFLALCGEDLCRAARSIIEKLLEL